MVMIETSAPPYDYSLLPSSPTQKKNYQSTEIISLSEVKHLVSLLDKGRKNALSVIFGNSCVYPFLLTSLHTWGCL